MRILETTTVIGGVEFTRAGGQHGSDEILEAMPEVGEVMGVILRHGDDPLVYIAGDTILTDEVRKNLDQVAPDVVVLNTGEAVPLQRWAPSSWDPRTSWRWQDSPRRRRSWPPIWKR